jgi:hypothetical protein
MDDVKIIEMMRKGDSQGLEAAMGKYRRLAGSIAQSVLGRDSLEDALECVNSAFHDPWQSLPSYDGQRT